MAVPAAKKTRRKKTKIDTVSADTGLTEYEKLAMTRAQANGLTVYHVVVKIDPHCPMPIAARQLIQNDIGSAGQMIAIRPDAKSPVASKQVEFVLASAQSAEQITTKGKIPTISGEVMVELMLAAASGAKPPKAEIKIQFAETETEGPSASAKVAPEVVLSAQDISTSDTPTLPSPEIVAPIQGSAQAPIPATEAATPPAMQENILRVEAGRIDSVLNLVGELIIGKSMLQQALTEFSKALS